MKEFGRLLLVSVALALLVVLLNVGAMREVRPARLFVPFGVSMAFAMSIGLLSWTILPRIAPKFSRSPFVRWVQLVASLAVLSLVGGTIAYLLIPVPLNYRESMIVCFVFTMLVGSVSFVVEEARHRLQASTLELRTRELERQKALQAASEAKLKSLESRIHPHFLFNTLNSISSLVRSNPEEAEATIERLAALLRFSLDRHGSLVRLEDELQITRDYLEIEKTRFGERLRYRIEVPDDLMGISVPALSIQTLAENSVKYAVGAQRAGAEILVQVSRGGETIAIRVTDTGPGFSPDSLPAGHGIDSLKQRLEALFGDSAAISARRLDPVGMEVAIRIPC